MTVWLRMSFFCCTEYTVAFKDEFHYTFVIRLTLPNQPYKAWSRYPYAHVLYVCLSVHLSIHKKFSPLDAVWCDE